MKRLVRSQKFIVWMFFLFLVGIGIDLVAMQISGRGYLICGLFKITLFGFIPMALGLTVFCYGFLQLMKDWKTALVIMLFGAAFAKFLPSMLGFIVLDAVGITCPNIEYKQFSHPIEDQNTLRQGNHPLRKENNTKQQNEKPEALPWLEKGYQQPQN